MLNITIPYMNNKFPEETKEITKIFIEKDAREAILAYLIDNSFTNTPEYQQLWLEYIDIILKSKKAQIEYFNKVVIHFIPEEYKNTNIYWNLDYIEGDLQIHD